MFLLKNNELMIIINKFRPFAQNSDFHNELLVRLLRVFPPQNTENQLKLKNHVALNQRYVSQMALTFFHTGKTHVGVDPDCCFCFGTLYQLQLWKSVVFWCF